MEDIVKTTWDFSGTITMEAEDAQRMYNFFDRILNTNAKTRAMLRRLTNRTRVRRNGSPTVLTNSVT